MIGRLNHVALVVSSLAEAAALYERTLGATVSTQHDLPEHGVSVVFIKLPNTKIELLQPLGDNSPLASFLRKNMGGGIHHVCFEVTNILQARDQLMENGARILGDGNPKIGAHGRLVLFLHPKDFHGALIEIEEV
jgi:methylmalonyl-CoA/ethylmalonyl-CoA epimerase